MYVCKPIRNAKTNCRSCILLCIIYFFLIFGNCWSQSITWQKTYDGPFQYKEGANSLCPSDGNNFYVVGYTYHTTNPFIRYLYVLKLNQYGDTIWTKINGWEGQIFGQTSVSDGNGGCVITGDGDTSFTARFDSNGNLRWWKNYGLRFVQCFDIKKAIDGGYIAAGMRLSGDWYGYAMRIDSSGNLQWQHLYPSTEYRGYEGVELADNGGYVLCGAVMDDILDTQQVLVTRINESGNISWDKRYTIYGIDGNAKKIIKVDKGYLIGGTTGDTTGATSVAYFMKIDTSGNVRYVKRFHSTKNEALWDMNVLSSNRYLFTLTRDSTFEILSSKILITDSLGNIIKEKIVTTPYSAGYIWLNSILPAANGDLIFAGHSELTDNDSTDVYVVRTDSMLNFPPIGIINYENIIPKLFKLNPAYPNPFNPETVLRFEIPKSTRVMLSLYDVTGRLIDILLNENKLAGTYHYKFSSQNLDLSSGVYFITLQAGPGFIQTQKLVLMK